MKLDILCVKFFRWEIGIQLGGDVSKFTLLKLGITLGIIGIPIEFKLIEISF